MLSAPSSALSNPGSSSKGQQGHGQELHANAEVVTLSPEDVARGLKEMVDQGGRNGGDNLFGRYLLKLSHEVP